jgi:hypothetical protein
MFHTVRHHQAVAEDDYMVRLVEERVGTTSTTTTGYTEPAYERGRTETRGRTTEEQRRRMD